MPSEACTPCRERKLRCDATSNIPCTRCRDTQHIHKCVIPPRQKRTINRHKRARIDHACGSAIDREQLSQHPIIIADIDTSCQRLDDNGKSNSPADAAPTNAQMEEQQPSPPAICFGITDLISSPHLPGEDYNSHRRGPSSWAACTPTSGRPTRGKW